MNPQEATLCGGPTGCGHPRSEHHKRAEGSATACTHKLRRGGREITCSCRQFKGVRNGSSVLKSAGASRG